ncbi:TPA: plasmid stabilization protein, partial [Clostridioides difficile]|nr:plasmid stabilization protein [Clostridioides difficile]HBG8881237.1 plasmid stabilization protein [Clostridioides difficile]HBG8902295.1 plasmid stabilization protein [Clostridioides difficile]HBG8997373.1 plasmid stabilization protein [Clostridioides difficile]HBG9030745.1 plasmid stabilization protein [Clostridioides difficile]
MDEKILELLQEMQGNISNMQGSISGIEGTISD